MSSPSKSHLKHINVVSLNINKLGKERVGELHGVFNSGIVARSAPTVWCIQEVGDWGSEVCVSGHVAVRRPGDRTAVLIPNHLVPTNLTTTEFGERFTIAVIGSLVFVSLYLLSFEQSC